MNGNEANITADAVALQERDEFREQGWLKLVAPAKVNLHLAIGARRSDGYHEAATVMHALSLHDIVYMRRAASGASGPTVRMVSCGDVVAPNLESKDNIASKAIVQLAHRLGRAEADIEVRIEKNIPSQGGLGGGSADAAAALVGAAHLWGIDGAGPVIELTARELGSDVAFFLRGGCAYHEGTGDVFVRALKPSKQAVALVKPQGGVSTAQAYRVFDENPTYVADDLAWQAMTAESAEDVPAFNNLTEAAESLLPQLADVRRWLGAQPGVQRSLLCGSGATSFAVCSDFATACTVVAEARKLGYWARATSFGSLRAMPISV